MKQHHLRAILMSSLLIFLCFLALGCSRGKAAPVNAAGPEPEFATEDLYVSIDQLKQELDRGANMIILDARPKQDYDMDHIVGAISMPFFEVEDRYKELPRDAWIVTYCACPRAEAENAANTLLGKGYKKVKVFYEGYFEWLGRGYPIEKG